MGIDDLKGKASDAMQGEKGEQGSDAALEKGSDAASSATGGKHDEQLDKAQSTADKKIGDQ